MARPVAIYPGTFDPVHEGHLALARLARDLLGATVHLVPDATPSHRPAPHYPFPTRLALVEAAVADDPHLVADPRSALLRRPSRTLDLVRSIGAEHGVRPYLLLSDEIAATLPFWEDPVGIARSARLVIFHRPGEAGIDRRALARAIGPIAKRIAYIDADLPDCRATVIRAALAGGRDPGPCLPASVRRALDALTAPGAGAEIEP
jgi:nicotinate-nucleotide adenylyltransferase